MSKIISKLSSKKHYLQIALNGTLEEARKIIAQIPINDRILIEVGTPLIKRYGEEAIRKIKYWYKKRICEEKINKKLNETQNVMPELEIVTEILRKIEYWYKRRILQEEIWNKDKVIQEVIQEKIIPELKISNELPNVSKIIPYVVADLKTMDRAETEVEIAARAGADAVIALGHSSIESLNAFIQKCEDLGLDAMVDMINVEYPLSVLRQLKKLPRVVILHRGVDEERFNKEKQIPLHEIRRIKGNYNDILISVAGGDTVKEVQRAIFNDADIVIVWKSFYQSSKNTAVLVRQFLKEIK